ncbi:hypothetical protein FA13DRAFT_1714684 [Coprinellus micaceus]|uniref:Uncharacterized protein n=1 Tax=Coprinellus micaceus TaxID=71717 RepID=A0A4Y7SR91_COPMI|nr:hypothetical protein FA13DRAFT_1714684 [Coprinellus micaceus]
MAFRKYQDYAGSVTVILVFRSQNYAAVSNGEFKKKKKTGWNSLGLFKIISPVWLFSKDGDRMPGIRSAGLWRDNVTGHKVYGELWLWRRPLLASSSFTNLKRRQDTNENDPKYTDLARDNTTKNKVRVGKYGGATKASDSGSAGDRNELPRRWNKHWKVKEVRVRPNCKTKAEARYQRERPQRHHDVYCPCAGGADGVGAKFALAAEVEPAPVNLSPTGEVADPSDLTSLDFMCKVEDALNDVRELGGREQLSRAVLQSAGASSRKRRIGLGSRIWGTFLHAGKLEYISRANACTKAQSPSKGMPEKILLFFRVLGSSIGNPIVLDVLRQENEGSSSDWQQGS